MSCNDLLAKLAVGTREKSQLLAIVVIPCIKLVKLQIITINPITTSVSIHACMQPKNSMNFIKYSTTMQFGRHYS